MRVKPRFCSVSVKFSPSRKSPISSTVAFKRITLKYDRKNRNNQESPFKSETEKCCTCCENCDVIRYLEITVSTYCYLIFIFLQYLKLECQLTWNAFMEDPRMHSSLLRTFGFSATSTYDSYLPLIFGKISLMAIFKIFVCAVFEAIEVSEVKHPRNLKRRKF